VADASLEVADVRLRHSEEHTDVGLARPCPSPEDGDHGTHVASGECRAHVLPVPKPRRRDRVGTLPSGHLKPARRTRADRHAWYTSAGLDPLAVAGIVLGMHSRATITDRSAAHQPAVDRGEQFTPGGVETRIGANSVEHAADGLSGRRGVPEQAGERIGLQVEELLKLLDRRRVRCPAALLPLPYGRWRAVDGSRHGALGKTSVFAGLAQGASKGLALGASAVHRLSMPDGLVGSPEDPNHCKDVLGRSKDLLHTDRNAEEVRPQEDP
jgi:hypothetical protein